MTRLPPAELLQAEPAKEPTDFRLGVAMGTLWWGFWAAVAIGTYRAGVWPW